MSTNITAQREKAIGTPHSSALNKVLLNLVFLYQGRVDQIDDKNGFDDEEDDPDAVGPPDVDGLTIALEVLYSQVRNER